MHYFTDYAIQEMTQIEHDVERLIEGSLLLSEITHSPTQILSHLRRAKRRKKEKIDESLGGMLETELSLDLKKIVRSIIDFEIVFNKADYPEVWL